MRRSVIRPCSVMEGDGIGPEISAATLARAARGRSRLRARACRSRRRRSALPRCAPSGTTFPDAALEAARAADGVILGPVSHNDYPPVARRRAQSVGRVAQAARSLRQHPPGPHPRRLSAALRRAGRSRDRAREHRRLLRRPLHVSSGPASSCRRPTSRSRCARSRAQGSTRIAEAAFALAHAPAQEGDGRAQGQRAARVGRAVPRMRARGRGALSRPSHYEEQIIDAMAALLVRDASPLRRDRHHQHVRRHPVRSRLRDRRQPRARRLAQCRRRARGGAGAARLGARHRRPGPRQSGLADRLGRDAARLARRAARRRPAACARPTRSRRRSTARSPTRSGAPRDLGGPLGTKAFGERVASTLRDSAK